MMRAASRSEVARGLAFVVLVVAGCGSASKPSGADGGAAGATGRGGADGGAADTTGRGGADGGAADTTGGGGAGGATQTTCMQHGGYCPGDCASACPTGTTAVTLACPIVPASAVCGGMHCCVPTTSYACGSDTCTTGQSFCYSFVGGVPGAGTSRSCMTLPDACAKNPTCACLCPQSSSATFGCAFAGGFSSASCSCTELAGQVTVSCAGA